VPGTLEQIESDKVAFLHLDMNCPPPEVAALEYLWDRLTPGAVILMDDYAFENCEAQKHAIDAALDALGTRAVSLPTGQGLVIKI
jgi:predicted O-methyltransferase YrrM